MFTADLQIQCKISAFTLWYACVFLNGGRFQRKRLLLKWMQKRNTDFERYFEKIVSFNRLCIKTSSFKKMQFSQENVQILILDQPATWLKILKKLKKCSSKNGFISPLSVHASISPIRMARCQPLNVYDGCVLCGLLCPE